MDLVDACNEGGWVNQIPQDKRGIICTKLTALARKHLRAIDADAGFSGSSDSEWGRFRDAQQAILNSLQETQKGLLSEFNKKSLEAEAAAKERHDKVEAELRKHYEALEEKLSQEHSQRQESLTGKEEALKQREASFDTKEARYVARQEQQNQIKQIKVWLDKWSLTSGTKQKRWPVAVAYAVGTALTAYFAVLFSNQNAEILKGKDLAQIAWWQWVLLSAKLVLPIAACISFVIYFIRWTSSWARLHAEEEFRNRARVLDIGRTSWLLEAVRDAQDNNKELPAELLKELSRNLFSYASPAEANDIHPNAITDLITQGLASLRVRTADGSEIEAKRSKS